MATKNTQDKTLPKVYEPVNVESRVYAGWKDKGYFKPRKGTTGKQFSLVLPPPNATGKLHLGHALGLSVQDTIVRYHRMKGDETVMVPGTDHAGISTQVMVENIVAKQGKTRHDFGREKFVDRIWEYVNEAKSHILRQHEEMGVSCDWDRERFTFDEEFNKVVNYVFETLYKKDLIFRDDYIVHWCSRCATVLSDLEAIPHQEESKLYNIRYFVKAADKSLIVATTRPETLLGDVAVAVHPEDKRYKEYIGKTLILPILNKEIPIIADERVEQGFGTGCVKITPGHDHLDFEIGRDHNLPVISIIGKDGKMNKFAGKFEGLDVLQARQNIIEYLDNIGNLESIEDIESSIRKCDRCKTVVEPLVSKQWFVRASVMAKKVRKAVDAGKTDFVPDRFQREFLQWIDNMRDWCISRQLWWGHRIPAYYNDKGEVKVSATPPKGDGWKQDEDVLDTWFSSALWPFVLFGWPEKTEDFKTFFPTSLLVCGRDILLFWVARMMMMSVELTGDVPFENVYLTGMIRDENNKKMSKTKGNGIEPAELQRDYGTDAMRLLLLLGTTPGNDIILTKEKAQGYRNFTNKLWNATRFITMSASKEASYEDLEKTLLKAYPKLHISQKWILSRLMKITEEMTNGYEKYTFGEAGSRLYEFTWNEFCDWYIEISKIVQNEYSEDVLLYGIMTLLKLWHPMAPFITEELWSHMEQKDELIVSTWPKVRGEMKNDDIEADFDILIDIVKKIRNTRHERGVAPGKYIQAHIVAETKADLLDEFGEVLKKLARLENIKVHKSKPDIAKKVSLVAYPFEVYLPLEGMIDLATEKVRLEELAKEQEKNLRILDAKLSNEGFLKNAPKAVVEAQIAKKEEAETILAKIKEQLAEIG